MKKIIIEITKREFAPDTVHVTTIDTDAGDTCAWVPDEPRMTADRIIQQIDAYIKQNADDSGEAPLTTNIDDMLESACDYHHSAWATHATIHIKKRDSDYIKGTVAKYRGRYGAGYVTYTPAGRYVRKHYYIK